ncbi:MAG: prepilin-type N-terminal cleavage/methylation domain-containing protein [Candidatus Omnitrophota bacterium]
MESMGTEVTDKVCHPEAFYAEGSRLKTGFFAIAQNDRRQGYTLIEVVFAVVVTTIAVAATLVIMSKMTAYTGSRGDAFDIANAVMVSQYAMDKVRDQRFPPTSYYGDLTNSTNSGSLTLSNTTYTYDTKIWGYDPSITTDGVPNRSIVGTVTGTTEYYDSTNADSMLGYRNLFQITVTVKKGSRSILQTMTYKTRNGYY